MTDSNGAPDQAAPAPEDQVQVVPAPVTQVRIPPLPVRMKPVVTWLTPELQARAAALEALVAENYEKFVAMRQELGVTIPATKILELKMEAVLDTLFSMSTRKGQYHRLEFEARFEQLMRQQIQESTEDATAAIEQAKQQLRQQLLSGKLPPGITQEQLIAAAQEIGMMVPEGLLKRG